MTRAGSPPVICSPDTRWRSEHHKRGKLQKTARLLQPQGLLGPERRKQRVQGSLRSKSNAPSIPVAHACSVCLHPYCSRANGKAEEATVSTMSPLIYTWLHALTSGGTLDRSALQTEVSRKNSSANSGLGGAVGEAVLPWEVYRSQLPQLLFLKTCGHAQHNWAALSGSLAGLASLLESCSTFQTSKSLGSCEPRCFAGTDSPEPQRWGLRVSILKKSSLGSPSFRS